MSEADRAGGALCVTRLTLSDFRCYSRLRLEVGSDPVVLSGANGAGKTNILEALSFLVPGRGLRRARLADPARVDGGGGWGVAALLQTPTGNFDLGTALEPPVDGREKRSVRVNGVTAPGQAALGEVLSAVWLTPRMDRLFQDGPSARRRFLDRLVSGFDAAHLGRLSAYEHSLRERARLLKADGGPADPAWLSSLEAVIAEKGVAVAAARQDMVIRLDAACQLAAGPFPRAALALKGDVDGWLTEMPALAVEEKLKDALSRSRGADSAAGSTSVGPHRSDLTAFHVEKNIGAELCSTGEQKALLVAIVLADARMQAMERGAAPLLLLDEVAAHLDAPRRAALFDEVRALGAQAWMTGTDATLFAPLRGVAQFLTVEDGAVSTG